MVWAYGHYNVLILLVRETTLDVRICRLKSVTAPKVLKQTCRINTVFIYITSPLILRFDLRNRQSKFTLLKCLVLQLSM